MMGDYVWMVLREDNGKLMMYSNVKHECEDWIKEMQDCYDFKLVLKLLSCRDEIYIKGGA